MMSSLREFWSDYMDVYKQWNGWLKKHWKGYLVLSVIITAICMLPYYIRWREDQKIIANSIRTLNDLEKQ